MPVLEKDGLDSLVDNIKTLFAASIDATSGDSKYTIQLKNKKDGTVISSIDIASASDTAAGVMSKADKAKLDGIASGANNYSLPQASASVLGGIKVGSNLSISTSGVLDATDTRYTAGTGLNLSGTQFAHKSGAGFNHIPTGGADGQVLYWASDGTAKWSALPAQSGGTVKQVKVGTSGHLTVTPTTADGETYTVEHATGDGHRHVPAGVGSNDNMFTFLRDNGAGEEPTWSLVFTDWIQDQNADQPLSDTLDDHESAIGLRATIASPTFTGTPKAPTPAAGTNTTQIATTEFVTSAIASAQVGAASYKGTIASQSALLATDYKTGNYWVASAAFTLGSENIEAKDMIFANKDKSALGSASDFDVVQANIDAIPVSYVESLFA